MQVSNESKCFQDMFYMLPLILIFETAVNRVFDGRSLSSTGDAIVEPVERRWRPSNVCYYFGYMS